MLSSGHSVGIWISLLRFIPSVRCSKAMRTEEGERGFTGIKVTHLYEAGDETFPLA